MEKDESKTNKQLIEDLEAIRKQIAHLEKSKAEAEELFRSITETITEIFWIVDVPVRKIVYISPAYEWRWGRTRESLYKDPLSFLDIVYPEDRERVQAAIELNEKAGKPFNLEYRITCPNETFRWIWSRGFPVQDKNGQVTRYVGIAQDITKRKRMEEGMNRTLSLLTATIESTADGILVVDTQGKIISLNRKFIEMWHIPKQIEESRDDDQALSFVLDQLKDPEGFLRKVRELYSTPEAVSYDELRFKDGRIFERYSQPQRIEEEVVGRVWSFRDVTDRKRAEREVKKRVKELEEFYSIAVGRELRMKDLKEEIEELKEELKKYKTPQ